MVCASTVRWIASCLSDKFSEKILWFGFVFGFFHNISAQIPTNQLHLWLRADSVQLVSGKVQRWYDLSPNQFLIQQTNASNQPLKVDNALGGKPAIRFNGSTTFLDGGDILDIETNSHTIFFVASRNTSNGSFFAKSISGSAAGRYGFIIESNLFYFIYQDNASRNITSNQFQSGKYYLVSSVVNRSQAKNQLFFNKNLIGETPIVSDFNLNTSFNFLIGAYNNSSGGIPPLSSLYLNGDIAEIIIYNRLLSYTERNAVENYLVNRYAPPLSLGPDITIPYGFCPITLELTGEYTNIIWSTGSTNSTTQISQNGDYWVSGTNIFGMVSYDTIRVTYPRPTIIAQKTNPCVNTPVFFHTGNFNSLNNYTIQWFNGYVGDTLWLTNYQGSVWAKVMDNGGCFRHTDTLQITLDQFSNLFSLGTDTTLCSGNSLTIEDHPLFSQFNSWQWSTGSTELSVPIFNTGTYSITVTNNNGCTAVDDIEVTIQGTAPTVDFLFSGQCLGSPTLFNNLTVSSPSDPILSVLWNFGNGNTSQEWSPEHTYASAGIYNVKITAIAESGCSNWKQTSVTIYPPPTAYFSVEQGCISGPYYFFDQSTPPEGASLSSYYWDFGDGNFSVEQNPQHTYSSIGTYTVTLTVTDTRGCSASYSTTITISLTLPEPQPFSLVTPSDRWITNQQNLTFQWNSSPNAHYYRLEIATDSLFSNLVSNQLLFITQTTVSPPAGKYYWRVVALNYCQSQLFSEVRRFTNGYTSLLSGLQLHFTASEGVVPDNGKVSQWQNLANNTVATQTNPAYRPEFIANALNGHPAVRFGQNGATFLTFDTLTVANPQFTVVMVYCPTMLDLPVHYVASGGTTTQTYGGIFSGGTLVSGVGAFDGQNTIRASQNNSNWQIVVLYNDKILVNGQEVTYGQQSALQQLKLNMLGCRTNAVSTQYFKGLMADFMVFNRRLSPQEASDLIEYLRFKYFPPVELGANPQLTCGSCNYTISAPPGYSSYIWSNESHQPQINVTQTGNYTLTVTDVFGFTSHDELFVQCPSTSCYPDVTLGPDIYLPCGFCDTTLSAYAPHFVSYIWSTGETTPTISVNQTGYYRVTVTDVDDYSSSDEVYVQCPSVSCDPPVNLGTDINLAYGFCPVTLSAGTIYSHYLWSTGEHTPTIQVTQPGTYWVRVTDRYNYVSSDTIRVNYPEYQWRDTAFCAGTSVTINPGLGDSYSYLWSTTAMTPTIVVTQPGTYWVLITDTLGCSLQLPPITVQADNLPQITWFPQTDTLLCNGSRLEVLFSTNYQYQWSNGSQLPYTAVSQPGIYRLTVTSPYGCSATDSINVTISGEAAIVDFSAEDGCSGTPLPLVNLTQAPENNPVVHWQWYIDQDLTDTLAQPELRIASPGQYQITLTAINQTGCISSITKPVAISQTPDVQIQAEGTLCVGQPILFAALNLLQTPLETYLWNFNNINFSTDPTPEMVFFDPGPHFITLTVTTPQGCSKTVETTIRLFNITAENTPISLQQPVSNQTIYGNEATFRWTVSEENLSHYVVEISNNISFTPLLIQHTTTLKQARITLPSGSALFWRVKGISLCNQQIYSEVRSITRFNPLQLNGLTLWLSADSVMTQSEKVVQWYDQSPNQFSLIQTTPDFRPTLVQNALGNKPAVQFNGTNQYLYGGNILNLGTNSHTIYIIAKGTRTLLAKSRAAYADGRYSIFYLNNKLSALHHDSQLREFNSSTIDNTRFNLIMVENNRPQNQNIYRVNNSAVGELPIDGSFNFNTSYDFLIGAYNNNSGTIPPLSDPTYGYLNGEIAEVIIFNRILTPSEKDQIDQYLLHKYSDPIDLGEDIYAYGFCPVTLQVSGQYTNLIWSTGSTQPSITVNQSGIYWVEGTNMFGQTTRDTIRVIFPEINLPEVIQFCFGSSITLEPPISGAYSFQWSNGQTTPSVTLSTPGNYWVRISDTLGCWIEKAFLVEVDSFTHIATLGPDRAVCSGNRIELERGAQEAVSYLWSNGSTLPYFHVENHTQISLTVTNSNGCVAIDTLNLTINGTAPALAFNHNSLCKNNQISFTDLSQSLDGSPLINRRWIFNNLDTLFGTNVNYLHNDTGTISVQLLVTAANGCYNDTTFIRRVNDLPTVQFTPTSVCERNAVVFQSTGFVTDGTIVQWNWQFPDAQYTVARPVHSFPTTGQFPVNLTLTSNHGCLNTRTIMVEVKPSPLADFEYTTPCEGSTVFFTNTSQTWLSTIADYFWTFDNQYHFTQTNPQYIFNSPGTYPVRLVTLQRVNQCRDTIVKNITVAPKPTASPIPAAGCSGDTLKLLHNSFAGNGYTISLTQWTAPVNSGSIVNNRLIASTNSGTYPLSLTVVNNGGCSDTKTSTLQIYEKPVAQITIPADTLYVPRTVTLSNPNHQTGYLNRWYLNQNLLSTNPTHTINITETGNYRVGLSVTNNYGCRDTAFRTFIALTPEIDIELLSVAATIFNEQLLLRIEIRNNGSVSLSNLQIKVTSDKFTTFTELMDRTVYPGQTLAYTLRTRPAVQQQAPPTYVCAEIVATSNEINISNNTQCYYFDNSLKIYPPYPNPASQNINVKLISETSSQAEFTIINYTGAIAYQTIFALVNGLNTLRLPIPSGSSGVVFLRIKLDDNVHYFKVLVSQ